MRYTQLKDRMDLIDSIFYEKDTKIFKNIMSDDIKLLVMKYLKNDFPLFKYVLKENDELRFLLYKMNHDIIESLKYNNLLQGYLSTYKLDKKTNSVTSTISFNELKEMDLIPKNIKSIQNSVLNNHGEKNFSEIPFLDEKVILSEGDSTKLGFMSIINLFQAYYLYGMYTPVESNEKPFKLYKTTTLVSESENNKPKLWNPNLFKYCQDYTSQIYQSEKNFLNMYCFELEFNHLLTLEISKQIEIYKCDHNFHDRIIFVLSHLTFIPSISHINFIDFLLKYGEIDSYSASWAQESITAILNFSFLIWPLLTQRFENNLANFNFIANPEYDMDFTSIRTHISELLKFKPFSETYDKIQEINSLLCMSITDEVLEEIWQSETSSVDILLPNDKDYMTMEFNTLQFDEYKIKSNLKELLNGNLKFFLKKQKNNSQYPSNKDRISANRKWSEIYYERVSKEI